MLIVMHKFVTNQLPIAFEDVYALNVATNPHRWQVKHLKQPFSNRNYRLFTTSCLGPKLWNEIISPQFPSIRSVPASKNVIKNIIRRHFISSYHVWLGYPVFQCIIISTHIGIAYCLWWSLRIYWYGIGIAAGVGSSRRGADGLAAALSFVSRGDLNPCRFSFCYFVIQALPGEWGGGFWWLWVGVPLCSCLARGGGDFRDWEDLCSYLVVGVFFSSSRYRKVWDWDRYVWACSRQAPWQVSELPQWSQFLPGE